MRRRRPRQGAGVQEKSARAPARGRKAKRAREETDRAEAAAQDPCKDSSAARMLSAAVVGAA